MARSRLGENQIRDEDLLTEAEHLVVDHSTCSGVPVTFLSLGDTPNTYEDGKYLVSTASGSVWQTGVQGDPGEAGVGVPAGGTTGQVLKKSSATDYDTEWAAESEEAAADLLTKIKTVDGTGSGLDADTVDAVEVARIVFGDNGSACRTVPTTEDLTHEAMWKGGFWQVNGAAPSDWSPTTDAWYWGLTLPHTGNTASYNYCAQIAVNASTGDIYVRKIGGGASPSASAWVKLFASASDLLTALLTVDGTGSNLDADKLDGAEGSSYLRSDENDTTTGKITISANGTDILTLNKTDDEQYAGIAFASEGLRRCILYLTNTAESGSNVGSDLSMQVQNDAGTYLGQVLTITRATQVVKFFQTPVVGTSDVLTKGDVDDTPVDAATDVPVSSNWAYDHTADADAHHNITVSTSDPSGGSDGDFWFKREA